GLRFSEKLNENEKERKEAEKEKLNSELAFLKNQISPHFFFNTLNNIYSLIEINTVDAQKAVLKLSKLMRYLLYESEQGDSKLSSEIEFMKAYVDLMRLRLNEKVELLVSFPDEFDDVLIPPLLLIPFIENAFKYGISYRDKSFIYLSLQVNNKELVFFCSNSLNNNAGNETHSGIGLENVKKRLNLLFPEKHSISINQKENSFDVLLKIDISTKEKRCEQ
ncbi:MAG: histidine kinase, partial [Bacteroidota bacterium]|nr:histidine kinase [Bacteroidota bacterium]